MSLSKRAEERGSILTKFTDIGNQLLDHPHQGISAVQVASNVGVTRRTAIRYLNALWTAGWADPTTLDPKPGRRWRPGPVLTSWSRGRVS